jgi:hypothetical protein
VLQVYFFDPGRADVDYWIVHYILSTGDKDVKVFETEVITQTGCDPIPTRKQA